MKNILNYYYNIYPLDILYKDNKYFFEYNNNKYVFEKITRPISDINSLYKSYKGSSSKDKLSKKTTCIFSGFKDKDFINENAFKNSEPPWNKFGES